MYSINGERLGVVSSRAIYPHPWAVILQASRDDLMTYILEDLILLTVTAVTALQEF